MQIRKLNKTLIALAALTVVGAASAQTTLAGVTLSGNIDVGYKSLTNTDSTKNKAEFINNNTSTSLVYFKGAKEVAKDLTASFLLELDFNPSQSSTLNSGASSNAYNGTPFNGEQWVALTGRFGDIKLGSPNSAALTAGTTAQPYGTALGGGYSGAWGRMGTASISGINQFDGNTTGRIIRHEKTAMYTTPVFSGFKATVEYAAANDNSTSTVANNTNGYTGFSLQYNVGPLNAIYSYSNEKAGSNPAAGATSAIGTAPAAVLAANTDVTWNMLAANYKFGNATIMGGYTTTKHNGAAVAAEDSKSWNIAGKYMVTPEIELLANYLVRDTQLTTAADAKLLGLGVNYYLNTATNLYVRYEGIKFDAFGSTAEQTQNVWAAGIRFQF